MNPRDTAGNTKEEEETAELEHVSIPSVAASRELQSTITSVDWGRMPSNNSLYWLQKGCKSLRMYQNLPQGILAQGTWVLGTFWHWDSLCGNLPASLHFCHFMFFFSDFSARVMLLRFVSVLYSVRKVFADLRLDGKRCQVWVHLLSSTPGIFFDTHSLLWLLRDKWTG